MSPFPPMLLRAPIIWGQGGPAEFRAGGERNEQSEGAAKVIPIYAAEPAAIIVDHTSTDLSKIPDYWLEQARKLTFHFAHTSHGSQLVTGLNTGRPGTRNTVCNSLRGSRKASRGQGGAAHL